MDVSNTLSIVEPILFAVFVAFVVIYIYFGITLTHHWNHYSFNVQVKRVMKGLYFFMSTFILLTLLVFMGLYIFGYGI